jgi:hypothetical protein
MRRKPYGGPRETTKTSLNTAGLRVEFWTEIIEYEAQVIQIRQRRIADLSYEGCMTHVLETWI